MFFEKAAPGAGVILYYRDVDGICKALFSVRGSSHGGGTGITGGGFVNCNRLVQEPAGILVKDIDEAYREMCEEFRDPGITLEETAEGLTLAQAKAIATAFTRILPYEAFTSYAQLLTAFTVRSADANKLHHCTFFALKVTEAQAIELMNLQTNNERLRTEAVALLSPAYRAYMERLHHKHELVAFSYLEKMEKEKRLA